MQIFLTILTYAFIAVVICCAIVLTAITLVPKSLLCAKIYTFIFEHGDWLLYKKAKKQGIQHYLNGYHFSQFYWDWNKVKDEYGVDAMSAADYLKLNEETANALCDKHDELAEKYHYKEYRDVDEIIKDDDVVLSLNMYSGQLYICDGDKNKGLLTWAPMVKDVIKSQVTKDRVFCELLDDPKTVISF